jgi:hypothetical protein
VQHQGQKQADDEDRGCRVARQVEFISGHEILLAGRIRQLCLS